MVIGSMIERAAPPLGLIPAADLRGLGSTSVGSTTDVVPESLAMVQFSSGTTVEPKPVALSHRAVMAQATILLELMEHYPEVESGAVSWLPLYHDMGLIGCVFPALVKGAPLTLLGPELFLARPATWLRAISRAGAMVSAAPNFAYSLCVERIDDDELADVDLSRWRIALNGAETVSADVMRRFTDRFAPFGFRPEALTPVYGLSEAALAVTFSDIDRPFRVARFDAERLAAEGRAVETADGSEYVSVGRALDGMAIELRADDGTALGPGNVGRLHVRSPSIMDGYLGRPDATAEVLVDGWLDTGDLGFGHDGELYLTGRAKDVLIIRGRNHAPQSVERAVDAVEGVRAGCSIAVTSAESGEATERLIVFVERARDSSRPERELAAECGRAILGATGLSAEEVVILPAGTLPRTSSGKLRRAEALRQHRSGELCPPEPVNVARIARAAWRSRRALRRFASGSSAATPTRDGRSV
jgi:acyl-CoA synthetase (AMP-forming)/AMP-acid ligase II